MSDYVDHEIIEAYATSKQIEELNKMNIELRKQIAFLETEVNRYEKLPMPRGVVEQVIQLEATIRKLEDELKYYKKHVPPQVIINRENNKKPTRNGGIPK
jgi:hypothetical protein